MIRLPLDSVILDVDPQAETVRVIECAPYLGDDREPGESPAEYAAAVRLVLDGTVTWAAFRAPVVDVCPECNGVTDDQCWSCMGAGTQ